MLVEHVLNRRARLACMVWRLLDDQGELLPLASVSATRCQQHASRTSSERHLRCSMWRRERVRG